MEGTRANGRAMTNEEFAHLWPQLTTALRRYALSRGASPADADDLVQECGLRLLGATLEVDDAQDVLPWCLRVLRNLHVDQQRRSARLTALPEVEVVGPHDVANEVATRVFLNGVLGAWSTLSDADRSVLRHPHGRAALEPRHANAEAAQRLRARRRLVARFGSPFAVLVGLARLRQRPAVAAGSVTLAATLSLALLPNVLPDDVPTQVAPPAVVRETALQRVDHGTPLRSEKGSSMRAQGRATGELRVRPERQASPTLSVHAATGDGAFARTHDPEPGHDGLVCVGGLPYLQPTCVPQPTARAASTSP